MISAICISAESYNSNFPEYVEIKYAFYPESGGFTCEFRGGNDSFLTVDPDSEIQMTAQWYRLKLGVLIRKLRRNISEKTFTVFFLDDLTITETNSLERK